MLRIRGCEHVNELGDPGLDLPAEARVLSRAAEAILAPLGNFYTRIWGFIGEDTARVVLR